jgi:predicted dehydrogenase
VATCDIVPEASAEIATMAAELNTTQYGEAGEISQHEDYKSLLARPEVEAVLLSLPIHLNYQIMLDSVLAGKHVICEKPIGANLNQARKVVATVSEIAENRDLVVEIAENYHYRQEVNEAKKWAFEEKAIGEVVMIWAKSIFRQDPTKGFASTPWRVDNQYRGGIVADGGVHYGALMRRLGGEVEQIQAFGKMMHPTATSSLDTLSINIRFRNGIIGSLQYSGAIAGPTGDLAECRIYGTHGTITLNPGHARLFNREGEVGDVLEQRHFEATNTSYYEEFLNFYEAVRQGKPVVATLQEAFRDFQIIMAAFDSAEESSVIFL